MNSSTIVSLKDAKDQMSDLVSRAHEQQERFTITKHGHPAAVIMSVDDLESLEETLDILSDKELMAQLRASDNDEVETLTKDEALALISQSRKK